MGVALIERSFLTQDYVPFLEGASLLADGGNTENHHLALIWDFCEGPSASGLLVGLAEAAVAAVLLICTVYLLPLPSHASPVPTQVFLRALPSKPAC